MTFTDASGNTPTSWAWKFGDGGTSTARTPTHVYADDGVYTVTLTVTDDDGGVGSDLYLFGRGGGQDRVSQWDPDAENVDAVQLGNAGAGALAQLVLQRADEPRTRAAGTRRGLFRCRKRSRRRAPPVVDEHVERFQRLDVVPPQARQEQGIARLTFTEDELFGHAAAMILRSRRLTEVMMETGLIAEPPKE